MWRRVLFCPGAVAMAITVSMVAALVAFVTTVIYANIDAGRPIATEPSRPDAASSNTQAKPSVTFLTPATIATVTTKVDGVLTAEELTARLAASVWSVSTLDEVGRRVEGSAFVIGASGGQTLVITSFAVVRASTFAPGPPITLRRGSQTAEATLWTWQEDRDLALLVMRTPGPALPMATGTPPKAGDRIWSRSASGSLAPGVVTGTFDGGIEHNVFLDDSLQGAPMLNQKGEVVAIATLAYNPGGRGSTTVFVGVSINQACTRILRCGSGNSRAEAPATSIASPTTRR